ncbi:diacylglycerol/lipid kinase family protein [Maribellus maritimus]|uniref:diacylglycerol/lipid kinase family protein n=1 Tax=Maribellus maritimus TaxID=2870838 RepID=UPI001EEC3A0D|nr:diacylglycerol kinase family protein [Maribellus maritimus]MCG6187110.1 diacylglycerol kinase family lipid kinase [Maribellus maritimus]
MKKKSKQKILFVINPKSGNNRKGDYETQILDFAKTEGFEYKIYKTTGENDSKDIRELLNIYRPDKVIAFGGDGTFNMVAAEMIGKKAALGIIPGGSANGLAFNLDIPTRFFDALEISIKGRGVPMDVIRVNDKYYCFHLSDVGINARIVKRFEKEDTRGMIGYGKQLFKELFSPKSFFSYNIETGGRKKRLKAEMIVIANAQSYGTGVKINPAGNISDGKFEIVTIKPYPWWFVFNFIFAGFTGNLHRMEYVKVYRSEKAKITLDKTQDFQIDGEVIGKVKNLKLEIIPNAIHVIRGR